MIVQFSISLVQYKSSHLDEPSLPEEGLEAVAEDPEEQRELSIPYFLQIIIEIIKNLVRHI